MKDTWQHGLVFLVFSIPEGSAFLIFQLPAAALKRDIPEGRWMLMVSYLGLLLELTLIK